MTTRDRIGRAEDYVLGLMDDNERMRAERDMAVDPAFRDCVLDLAQKLQRLHETKLPGQSADEAWSEIAARIAQLPQMAGMTPRRNEAGRERRPATPSAARPRNGPRIAVRRPAGRGLHETGGRRGLVVMLGIVAMFAIGYLVGHLR